MGNLFNRYRRSINPPYNIKDFFNLFFTLFLLIALPVGIYLSQQNQDVRNRAQEEEPGDQSPQVPPQSESVPDEVLIKFKAGVSEGKKNNVRKHFGIKKQDEIKQIGVERGKVPEKAKDAIIQALSHNPMVEYAEPNILMQSLQTPAVNDPLLPQEWYLDRIHAPAAWNISKGNSSTVIALIDSGVNATHEDLSGKILPGINYGGSNFDTSDTTGHGTSVAGIAAAITNNGKGIASICPLCMILPVKATGTSGNISSTAASYGLIYAADSGAKVANMSFGGGTYMQNLLDATNYAWNKGMVIVAAAGNGGSAGPAIDYPAQYPNVMAVGYTDGNDTRAGSYGPELDIMAPGVGITSTSLNGGYNLYSGSSSSAPIVAAEAALIFSANASLTNQQVVNIITSTAKDLGEPGWDQYYGYGIIDAEKALQMATGEALPSPTPSPSPKPTSTPIPLPTDTTNPSVSLTSPINGQTVSGTVTIFATAVDNVAVSSITFKVDTILQGVSSNSPYSYSLDTTQISNGSHTITASALDSSNNSNESSITITVNNQTSTSAPTPTPVTQSNTLLFSSISTSTAVNGATVKWTTSVPSTSRVVYGTSSGNLNFSSTENSSFLTSHSVTLSGLTGATRYYFKVISKNTTGKEFTSTLSSLRTKNK